MSQALRPADHPGAAQRAERVGVGALERVGRVTNGFLSYIGGVVALGGETASTIGRLRIRFAETVNQCYLLGYQSLIIVLLTSLFTGMVFSLESAVQAVQYGFGSFVGGIVSYTNVRELGPMLTAVVVAGRVCAAIAAEIGSMAVTEQVDALESLGLAPVRFLVVPRVLALIIMLPLLTVFADVVGVMGGQWIASSQAHISYDDFMSSARQTIGFEDVVKGLLKSVVFGVVIAIIGSYQGLTTTGGAAGVGKSTTSAVVTCIIIIFILNFLMSFFLYGTSSVPDLTARLDDVTVRYGERIVLSNCSLDIVDGAITCIIGMSGAGKSTILRLLDGLRKPDEGHVYIRDMDICHMHERDLNELRTKIGYAFQFAALFDSMTLGDNVALPLREHTALREGEIREIVIKTLDSVGLAHAYDNMPAELSGGMLKRAGFARAVVTNPDLVLYDEPTTGLDPIVTHLLTDTIMRLRRQLSGTAVVISHDLEPVYRMADYIAMLFEGAIIEYGTVEEVRASPNPIVQQFLTGSELGPIPL